jgi:soluble lytic murein transglycosylase
MKRILKNLPILLLLLFPSTIHAEDRVSEGGIPCAARLFHEGSYDKAIDKLKAMHQSAEVGSPMAIEASYLLGMSYRALNDWKEAANWLEKASRYQALADYAMFYLGETHLDAGDYQPALVSFQALLARFPESRWREEAGFKVIEAFSQLGRYGDARSSGERFISGYPNSSFIPKTLMSMAEGLEKEGRLRDSYDSYKNIWLSYPTSPESKVASERMSGISSKEAIPPIPLDERYSRACNLLSYRNYKEAINELITVLKEAEKDETARPKWFSEAILNLGDAYYLIRDDEKAVAVLNRLQETAPLKIKEEAFFIAGKALQRSGKRTEAIATFEKLAKDHPDGEFVAKAFYRLADMAEGDGDMVRARELYKGLYTEFPKNSLSDDAIWKEGWLSYLEKDYKEALGIFQRLLTEYPSSEFEDTAAYWSGRAAEKMGLSKEAAAHYSYVIDKFPLSYYALLSKGRLSSIASETPPVKVKTITYRHEKRQIPDRYVSSHLEKGKTLLRLGFKGDASKEFSLAGERCNNMETLMEIANLLGDAGDYHRAQRIGMKALQEYLKMDGDQQDPGVWKLAFPLAFGEDIRINAERNSLSPHLIHAIIREESSYRPDALSRAGAIGLMQLMPFTGNHLSKKAGLADYSTRSLYEPGTNITMGSLYLKKLIEGNKGNLLLAIASYNAGPDVVSSWASRFGSGEMDEFIERIPYRETRNYVKRVLRSHRVYEILYGQDMPGTTKQVTAREETGALKGQSFY